MTPRACVAGLVTTVAATIGILVPAAQPARAQDLADPAAELAERYAPVLRIRAQAEPCGEGQPYLPVDIDTVLDNRDVALRGPWSGDDLAGIAPSATDIGDGLGRYHLDFPGDALDPGCDFEEWSRELSADSRPTAYARVVGDPGRPDQIALQYWFFYVFNDWNNNHEGDWEMIQLVFDAPDAAAALRTEPTLVGYSQHSGGEGTTWDSDLMEVLDDTHPVVYPAEGSHANFFGAALYLGRSADTGVGCDDTRKPHTDLRPDIALMPTDQAGYLDAFPWLGFQGRWGERHEAFYNGPTGPNMKHQWTEPIQWAEQTWRDGSVTVPLSSAIGPNVTNAFCGAVETGSNLLRAIVRNPGTGLAVLAGLAAIVIAAASRTRWTGAAPMPVVRRRAWGQVLTAAWRMYARHWPLFTGIGLVYLPVMALATGAQWLAVTAADLTTLTGPDGDHNALTVLVVVLIGDTISLLAYLCVLAAVSHSVDSLGRGRVPSPLDAYRAVMRRLRPLSGVAVRIAVVVALLLVAIVTAPLALVYAVRRAFAVPVVMIEQESATGALRRSRQLVRGRWWRTALLLVLVVGLGAIIGPLVGIVILLVSGGTTFWLINLVAGIVYAATMPYVALVIAYQYADLTVRSSADDEREPVLVS
ncbi:Vps62-related protein [Jiangella alba]|uniref:DUF946 domain-containing protein n=1 Tax=Jiangella alba TaxID=561176 RepID=A0A1H5L7T1_9ACTN|nr:Vps62-related protein [Jiangella alba]SEE73020.1 protein of unknown function [Jiangella alba]